MNASFAAAANLRIRLPPSNPTNDTLPLAGQSASVSGGRVPDIVDHHPIISEILEARKAMLGPGRVPYEGHVYRVFNFCRALHGGGAADDAIAVASAFHD